MARFGVLGTTIVGETGRRPGPSTVDATHALLSRDEGAEVFVELVQGWWRGGAEGTHLTLVEQLRQ